MPNYPTETQLQSAAPGPHRKIRFRRKALNYAGKVNIEQFTPFQSPTKSAQVLAFIVLLCTAAYFIESDYSTITTAEITIEPHNCVSDTSINSTYCLTTLSTSGKVKSKQWFEVRFAKDYIIKHSACRFHGALKINIENSLIRVVSSKSNESLEKYQAKLILSNFITEFPTEKISCRVQLTGPRQPLYRIFISEADSA
ncbi:hypothetical protein ACU684_00635 [Pseudomonas sp. LF135]